MVLLFFMMVFADIFFEGGVLQFCFVPPGSSLGSISFILWENCDLFCILKHL